MRSEAQFNTVFGKWARYCYDGPTAAFELKLSKKPSIPFSEFTRQEQQLPSLQACRTSKGSYHKISDQSMGKKSYDCFIIKNALSYFVIMYYLKRGDKEFIMIEPDVLELEMQVSVRKSLTLERAREIGVIHYLK